MQTSLAFTALLMGIVGGPHCVVMCGAACAGIARASAAGTTAAVVGFQAGRVAGYALLGGVAALSLQGLGWLTVQSAALRPVWSLFHVAAALLGLVLLWQARQPVWLEGVGRAIWTRVRGWLQGPTGWKGAPLVLGALWALLPCGLLYSAVLVAAMAGSFWAGAVVMAAFALGTALTMSLGPLLWLKLATPRDDRVVRMPGTAQLQASSGAWGVRLAGAALAASSVWALWMGLVHNAAPWCISP